VPAVIKAVRNRGFRDFSFACRELAELTGNDMKTVIDHEVAAILQDAAANTKVATVNGIISNHTAQEWVTYDIPYGGAVRGRESYFAGKAAARRGGRNAMVYSQKWRMPNWLWSEMRARRAAALQRKISRAGVAAKHWYEQAMQLGYNITVDPRVKNASNNSSLAVETARRSDPNNYAVEGKNFSELSNRWAGGANALGRAVAKRVNLFQRSMRQWAAGKTHLVAKKYPNLLKVS